MIKSLCTFKRQVNRWKDTDCFSSPAKTLGEQTYFLSGTTFNWVLSSVNSMRKALCGFARTPLSGSRKRSWSFAGDAMAQKSSFVLSAYSAVPQDWRQEEQQGNQCTYPKLAIQSRNKRHSFHNKSDVNSLEKAKASNRMKKRIRSLTLSQEKNTHKRKLEQQKYFILAHPKT